MSIPLSEFRSRLERIQAAMDERNLDAVLVYGDEYRLKKERRH